MHFLKREIDLLLLEAESLGVAVQVQYFGSYRRHWIQEQWQRNGFRPKQETKDKGMSTGVIQRAGYIPLG